MIVCPLWEDVSGAAAWVCYVRSFDAVPVGVSHLIL